MVVCFFFFQAEDGIRVGHVTGVQTCALPICNSQPAASQSGSFTVQVAAYSTKEGADQRRQQLSSAGVNNAFVESGSGAAGTTYRLRVGPFETRQAAEAALTRLRSLGYEDSFIRSQ